MVVVIKQNTAHIIRMFFKKLRKYVGKMKKDGSAEAIHLFRVEIKKLRAFLRLLSLELKKEDELKLPSKIKKMYKYAGKVRDRQLRYKRMKAAIKNNKQQFPEIKMVWNDVAEKRGKRENKLLSDEDFLAAELKLRKKLPNEIGAAAVKTFFRLKLDNILSIANKGSYSNEELHTIRKGLKDIIYIIKLYHSEMKIKLPFTFWNKRQEKAAEQLAQALGIYNDLYVDLSFLKRAMKKNDHTKKNEMQSLRNIWLAEKRKLKKEIVNSIAMPDLFKIKKSGLEKDDN